ncbi:hypothetical protein ACFLRM_05275 [Acidobacteriota bacterium]
MKIDNELKKAIVEKAQHHRDSVPVFRIVHQPMKSLEKEAVDLALRYAADHGIKGARFSLKKEQERTIIQLPEDSRLQFFHASGAMIAESGWNPFSRIISNNAEDIDQKSLIKQAHEVVHRLKLDRCRENEQLRFDRLWKIKASGVTRQGKQGAVNLIRVVGAFRRYLNDLPVWGCASVFIKLAEKGQVDSLGIDWRPVSEDPIDEADIIDPGEGAKRILEELQITRLDNPFTLEDFEIEFFTLSYFSLPKRRQQTIMQPVWIALLRDRVHSERITSLNHLAVVPAANSPYESIYRTDQLPILNEERPLRDS